MIQNKTKLIIILFVLSIGIIVTINSTHANSIDDIIKLSDEIDYLEEKIYQSKDTYYCYERAANLRRQDDIRQAEVFG